jgi:hypothetical protein
VEVWEDVWEDVSGTDEEVTSESVARDVVEEVFEEVDEEAAAAADELFAAVAADRDADFVAAEPDVASSVDASALLF